MPRQDTRDYLQLFLHDVPLIDTRAPVEFARGAFPTAVNLPLMKDEERARVGRCYKESGQQAAIRLGHELVHGPVREARVAAWQTFCQAHPEGYLYCFRGGLRSQICQQWLSEADCPYPRVEGGYKAMRRFLIEQTEAICARADFLLIAGHTGSAKTVLLENQPLAVDLEGLAHHRGSAFGRRAAPQPSQIDFENALAVELLKRLHSGMAGAPILLEDESRLIGRCALPEVLRAVMSRAPMLVVEESLEARVEHTYQRYILDKLREWQERLGEQAGFDAFAEDLLTALDRIRRRLGGDRHQQLRALLQQALQRQQLGDPSGHRDWIVRLLLDYYDPMYAYQMSRRDNPVRFRGQRDEVAEQILRL